MRVMKAITSCAAAVILSTNAAYAEEEPRGAITAISHVAAGVSADTPHNGFRWAETRQESGPAVNTTTASRQSGFRWASHPGNQSNGQTAAVEALSDANQRPVSTSAMPARKYLPSSRMSDLSLILRPMRFINMS